MIACKALIVMCAVLLGQSSGNEGSIGGVVVNASDGRRAAGGAKVVLRVDVDGQFVIAAETAADAEGRFLFEPLPLDPSLQYLPGANRGGVHYPGERIRLAPDRPHADVELVVYDSVEKPNPLVACHHEIIVRPLPGALKVTETILVDNPTATCYVGQTAADDAQPVTLQLAIPSDFERTTFEKEFFGRRFSIADGKLATGVPWPPGEKELKFTYVVPNEKRSRLWERPLDLPCSHVRLSVVTDQPDEVCCNLGPGSIRAEDGEERRQDEQDLLHPADPVNTVKVFESDGRILAAGYVLRLEMGRLPVPWMAYGRWAALVALVGLIAGASAWTIGRRRRQDSQARATVTASGPESGPKAGSRARPRNSRRRGRRRKAPARRLR